MWSEGPMALFDTETSGPEPTTARLVTATVVLTHPSASGAESFSWLADPGIEIPQGAIDVHGITTEHAREHGRPAEEVVKEVAVALGGAWANGCPVVGYNVSYDLTLLAAECGRHGVEFTIDGPVIDPMVIDKRVDRYRRGSRKLVDVCRHYGVRLDGAHDATEDALAAGRVAWVLARRYPAIGRMPLDELHTAQARWYAEQQHSFADYLRDRVAGQVEREAESLQDEQPEEAEQKRAELADLRARADDIDATAGQWPIRRAES